MHAYHVNLVVPTGTILEACRWWADTLPLHTLSQTHKQSDNLHYTQAAREPMPPTCRHQQEHCTHTSHNTWAACEHCHPCAANNNSSSYMLNNTRKYHATTTQTKVMSSLSSLTAHMHQNTSTEYLTIYFGCLISTAIHVLPTTTAAHTC